MRIVEMVIFIGFFGMYVVGYVIGRISERKYAEKEKEAAQIKLKEIAGIVNDDDKPAETKPEDKGE